MASATPRPSQQEIATIQEIGRDITRPWIGPLLDPQDQILFAKGGSDLALYEETLRDDQVRATLQQRFGAGVACEWEVKAGGDSRFDKKAAEFIKEQLNGILWDNACEKMLYGIYYGYSIAECLWAHDGTGLVTFDDSADGKGIRVRNRRRFRFDPQMQPRLITLQNNFEGEVLPARKFWQFSIGCDNDDDPYGRGLAHWLYWPVFFKRSDIRFWLTFLEKFGTPTVVGKYEPGTSAEDQRKLLQAAAQIMNSAAVKIPSGMQLELLEAGRSGSADYAALHDQMNAAISKIVLSQTMTTDSGSSLSQAQVHEGVARRVVKSDADLICQSFNRQVVRWLTDWNFPGAVYPQVWRVVDPPQDKKAIAETDKILVDMGYPLKSDYVRETYGDNFQFAEEGEDSPPPLNGAQVQALTGLLQTATQDSWSGGLVQAVLSASFPGIPGATIQGIADELDANQERQNAGEAAQEEAIAAAAPSLDEAADVFAFAEQIPGVLSETLFGDSPDEVLRGLAGPIAFLQALDAVVASLRAP